MSADALQVYRGLETLTGAATPAEQQRLEHRLLSILPVDAAFSAGRYAELAHREIDELLAAGRRPIVVGGTGLYLRAALADLDLRPPVPAEIRRRRMHELAQRGPQALHEELRSRAPEAATMASTDSQRIVRALELLDAGHTPPAGEQLWTKDTRHPTLLAGLTMERAALDARIDERVDEMVAAGAREEVERAAPTAVHDRAQGARVPRAARRRRRGDEDPHAPLRAPPADLDAQAAERHARRRHRPRP